MLKEVTWFSICQKQFRVDFQEVPKGCSAKEFSYITLIIPTDQLHKRLMVEAYKLVDT